MGRRKEERKNDRKEEKIHNIDIWIERNEAETKYKK